MKYFSLFSGIGGFELGIGDKAECVGFSEIDKYAVEIYKKHFPDHKNYGDITKIASRILPDFDLLVGGFPCPSFSVAGKGGGFTDKRGQLFFDIARIIKQKRPKYFLLENVKGLLSNDNGNTFRTIVSILDGLRYDFQWQVLNSKNFGVPQNRERVFIIGHLRGKSRPEVFPFTSSNRNSIKEITSKLPQAQRIYNQEGISPTLDTGQGGNRQPKILAVPLRYLNRNQRNYQGEYSFTLDASQTGGIMEDRRIRKFTPREYERLQGFPDDWTEGVSDSQRYKVLGNAVTVNVIKAIIEKFGIYVRENTRLTKTN